MKDHRNIFVLFIAVLSLTSASWASETPGSSGGESSRGGGLEWDQVKVDSIAEIGDDEATAVFNFTNTGDQPVTILKSQSGCGCTTTRIEGSVYQPGESGTLEATFIFGGRIGKQTKQIVVKTDDPRPRKRVTTLTLSVKIPELVRIKPKMVYWKRDEPRTPKAIIVKVVHDEPIKIVAAKVASNGPVTTQVKEIKEGKVYEVIITPTGEEGRAAIQLKTDTPDEDKPISFHVIARVIGGEAPATQPASPDSVIKDSR